MKGRSIFEITDEEIQEQIQKSQRNVAILFALAMLGGIAYLIFVVATL